MDLRNVFVIGAFFLIFAIAFATPTTTAIPDRLSNSNNWYNGNVDVNLSVACPENNTCGYTFYTFDMNVVRTPKPNLVFAEPLTLNDQNNSIRFYTSAVSKGPVIMIADSQSKIVAPDDEAEKVFSVKIDSVSPLDGMYLNNGADGIKCDFNYTSRRLVCNLTQGIISIPTNPEELPNSIFEDKLSGIDYCSFNFDYNVLNPTAGWGSNISAESIPNPMVYVYDALGIKVVAIKCTDKAGNSTTSVSTDAFDIFMTKPTVALNVSPTPNVNNWNKTPVTLHLSGEDSLSGIKEIRYCIRDTNTTSDGCRVTNPDYNKLGADRNKTIPKNPMDYNIFTGDISLNDQGITLIKAYSVNNQGTMSDILSSNVQIDTTPPQAGIGVISGVNGTRCTVAGKTINCDLNLGVLKIFGTSSYFGFYDIAYCEFNFDYNNPESTWIHLDANSIAPSVNHYYTTTGTKVVAVNCFDKADNNTLSLSTPVYTINVVGAYVPLSIDVVTKTPTAPRQEQSIVIDTNITGSNPVDVNVTISNGSFVASTLAVLNTVSGVYEAIFDTNTSWPVGDYNILVTAISADGQVATNNTTISLAQKQSSNGGSSSGGGSRYVPSKPADTNVVIDTNVLVDTNKVVDINKLVDNNASNVDTNKSSDTNALRAPDSNALVTGTNASPATGFFGLFGGNNANGGFWILPLLIIVFALFIIALYIRKDNLAPVSNDAVPKKRFSSK